MPILKLTAVIWRNVFPFNTNNQVKQLLRNHSNHKRGLSIMRMVDLLALYFTLILNWPFWNALFNSHGIAETWRYIPLLILLFFMIRSFLLLFSWRYSYKIIYSLLLLIGGATFYASYHFGVYYHKEIIASILETTNAEAIAMVSVPYSLYLLVFSGVPIFLLWWLPVRYPVHWKTGLKTRLGHLLLGVVVIILLSSVLNKSLANLRKNHSELQYLLNPFHFVYGIPNYIIARNKQLRAPHRLVGEDAVFRADDSALVTTKKPRVVFFVLGETARSDHYQLNGYELETNPFTQNEPNLISFQSVSSCGTATYTSVPCLFSRFTRETYDAEAAWREDGLLDILQRAGTNLFFKENNTDCKGICERVNTLYFNSYGEDYSLCDHGLNEYRRCIKPHWPIKLDMSPYCRNGLCWDEVLTQNLQNEAMFYAFQAARVKQNPALRETQIAQNPLGNLGEVVNGNTFITLHLLGSHGPNYFERYPDSFRHFTPDCRRDLERCSQAEIIRAYDNSLRYTDFILSQVIETAKAMSEHYETAVIYVSDHGESLGENGLYLHGLPYAIAPDEQTQVPLIMWFSDILLNNAQLSLNCLSQKAQDQGGEYSHDNVFHSILGLMRVETRLYDAQLDLFASCQPSR